MSVHKHERNVTRRRHRACLIAIVGVLSSCWAAGCREVEEEAAAVRASQAAAPPSEVEVMQYGGMRAVMRDGETEGRFALSELSDRPGAIGVGALEALGGEVTILNGEVWVARVGGDATLSMSGPQPVDGDHATLLTLADAPSWRAVRIEREVSGPELDELVAELARGQGVDVSRPFPFVIEGACGGLDLHVINGVCPIAQDPSESGPAPWRLSMDGPAEVTVVGFHAPNAAGVMTHHGTSIHAHAILRTENGVITGHIDRVVVRPGMTLRVPG